MDAQVTFNTRVNGDAWCVNDSTPHWDGREFSRCFMRRTIDGLIPLACLSISLLSALLITLFHLYLVISRRRARNKEAVSSSRDRTPHRRRRSSIASQEIKRAGLSAITEAENEVILAVVRDASPDLSAKELETLAGETGSPSAIDDEDEELERATLQLGAGMVVSAMWSNKKDVLGLLGAAGVLGLSVVKMLAATDDGANWLVFGVTTWVSRPVLGSPYPGSRSLTFLELYGFQSWMTLLSLIKLAISVSRKLGSLQAPNRPHRGLPRVYTFLELNLIPWLLVYQVIAFQDVYDALTSSRPSTAREIRIEVALFALTLAMTAVEMFSPRPSRFTSRSAKHNHSSAESGNLPPSHELNASLYSLLTFSYVGGFLFRHARTTIQRDDIPDLRPDDRTARVVLNFRRDCGHLRRSFPKRARSLGMTVKLLFHFRKLLMAQQLWALITALSRAIPSLFLRGLLNEIAKRTRGEEAPVHVALLFATGMFFSQLISTVAASQALYIGRRIGIRLRSVLIGEIFTKALRRKDLAGSSQEDASEDETGEAKKVRDEPELKEIEEELERASSGKILNLIAIDTFRISEVSSYLHFIFPDLSLEIVIIVILLFQVLGWAAMAGVIVLVTLVPIQAYLARRFNHFQTKLLAAADARISLATEVITSVRIVKYFAWEEKFLAMMHVTRLKELDALWSRAMVIVSSSMIFNGAPVIVSLATFVCQTKVLKRELTASDAFTALSLFNVLRGPLEGFPDMVVSVLQAHVSLKRIDDFLNEQETAKYAVVKEPRTGSDPIVGFTDSASFTWADEAEAREDLSVFRIRDLNLSFPVGKFSIILGPVGSGKTTLLMSLLGETNQLSGSAFLPSPVGRSTGEDPAILTDTTAYAAQSPWLMSATIRDNILFGSPMNERRYKDVLEACALNPDLKQFELGEDTEVGEKGTVLSGGQKARLALARAVYSPARTILGDDVLSAVDSHTAQHLVNKCFKGPLMRHRTIVLVTHAVDLCLPVASYVVSMDAGSVISVGSPAEISLGEDFIGKLDPNASHIKASNQNESQVLIEAIAEGETDAVVLAEQEEDRRRRQEKLRLIKDETKSDGAVSAKVYLMYLRAMGGFRIACVSLSLFVLAHLSEIAVSLALRWWSSSYDHHRDVSTSAHIMSTLAMSANRWASLIQTVKHTLLWAPTSSSGMSISSLAQEQHSTDYWMKVYCVLVVINLVLYGGRVFFFLWRGIIASRIIYETLVIRILRAPIRFFDSTPQGRILNRLSKDVETIDQDTSNCLMFFCVEILGVFGIIITISIVLPVFLIAAFFISIIYMFMGWLYICSSRELNRFDSVSKSPIFSIFGESLAGVSTIRAFGDSTRFMRDIFKLVDLNNRPFIAMWQANRWLSFRVDVAGIGITVAAAVLILLTPSIDAGAAGFILSFTMSFMDRILWAVRLWSMVEINANSIERVQEYLEIDQEKLDGVSPPAVWPSRDGTIVVENLTATYSSNLPPVLKNVSFSVAPREKIGICGRTGSGKSTLGLCFFRFIEATSGRIVVDGLDIAKLNLSDLRSRLTIVAQESALFAGTIRFNLDPFEQFEDSDVWDALRRVQMAAPLTPKPTPGATPAGSSRAASPTEDGSGESDGSDDATATATPVEGLERNIVKSLDMQVSEGGKNFSAGQRQLLALARGILKLRTSNILLLDESTASLDQATDEHIQTTIREQMSDATILCIAHRLKTIIDYDKILVLGAGEVLEFDTPANLINDETSVFADLCRKSGDFDELKAMADGKTSSLGGCVLESESAHASRFARVSGLRCLTRPHIHRPFLPVSHNCRSAAIELQPLKKRRTRLHPSFNLAPTSNVRLFGLGLALAFASALYPRLPYYLPSGVSSLLPFLGPEQHLSKWHQAQTFQNLLPHPANHDPFDVKEPEAERQRRLLSEDGENQKRKEEKRLQREWEKRIEMAGGENRIHPELPAYFVQAPSIRGLDRRSPLGQTLSKIGDEIIHQVKPNTILLLVPVETTQPFLQVSTLESLTYVSSSGVKAQISGNPSLAQSLITSLAYASPAVPAVSSRQNLHDSVAPVLETMFGTMLNVKVVQISVPVLNQGAWDSEKYFDIGHALLKPRQEEQDVVVLALGKLGAGKNLPLLDDALAHHTHHPRFTSLLSLIHASSGKKPSRAVPRSLAAIYTAVGAAGEGEGARLDEQGNCWRFGAVPMTKNPK
ncbi:BZ3500_MvSof-1268-A1-R1_Chr1-1g00891 [Microbotryum saponariae]|uniref:BZ3500_MvSof-1268-A1-R1_Chr1-1g00891 protein n=1 Tax=Microbotryum saponariae TaxID=289078 RepID=A0A2X0KS65_9BASI|nr:BZ3500_MvSof-1268-A1-R1_Chr1-1g00891 [Microbotryum saponariae]SCZ92871.1 BZ3501_MvSof-1269-A2-R1_Chr1-1g00488 [Microbotryum saponariae]